MRNRLPFIRDPWAPTAQDEAEFGFITEIIGGLVGGLTGGGKKEEKPKTPPPSAVAGASLAPWALGVGALLFLVLILGRPRT